ncbi:hypothetical protein B0H14DRAFT_2720686, partial [Mycena olivaceomarginata]
PLALPASLPLFQFSFEVVSAPLQISPSPLPTSDSYQCDVPHRQHTCALPLDPSRAGRRRTHCRGRCLTEDLCSM